MPTFACDDSYYNPGYDDTYPHPWAIFRCNDGTFVDPKFAQNRAWADRAVARRRLLGIRKPRLQGYTVYSVYRPLSDTLGTLKANVGKPSPRMTVMVDVESWGGQIKGDQSGPLTQLVEQIAQWLGSRDRVLVYGNKGDLESLYPNRPKWLRLIVAGYGTVAPSLPNMIGWQYTDGSGRWPAPKGYPTSSRPFGPCDHNVFPNHTPKQLAVTLGVAPKAAPKPTPAPAPAPAPTPAPVVVDPEVEKLKQAVRDVLNEGVPGPGGKHLIELWYPAAHPRLMRSWERAAKKGNK